MHRFVLSCLLAFTLTVPATGLADSFPIDLSTWTVHIGNYSSNEPNARWVLSNANTTVEQVVNADASFYTNNLDLDDYTMRGTWQVATVDDNDYIGFVFGYQNPAHCYVMSWKQGYQDETARGYGIGEEGFSIRKLDASSETDLVFADFWNSTDTAHATILASDYGSTRGWRDNTLYTFALTFTAGSFRVVVAQDSTALWDVTVNDDSFPSGQFGFYNLSQSNVRYSGFTLNTPPECHAGGPYNGDAGVPVQFDASASVDIDGSIVSYAWDFGDGTTDSGPSPVHTYTADGVYGVTLCVTDNEGVTRCCEPQAPVVPSDDTSWGNLKASYR